VTTSDRAQCAIGDGGALPVRYLLTLSSYKAFILVLRSLNVCVADLQRHTYFPVLTSARKQRHGGVVAVCRLSRLLPVNIILAHSSI